MTVKNTKHCKRSIIALLFFALSVYPAAGQQAFTLDFRTGFLYGTSYELIYDIGGNSQYVSELQWNMHSLPFAGVSVEYAPKEPSQKIGFYGVFGIKLGFPMETGVMEDRDWLAPTTTLGSLTHFSSHENKTKSAIIADLEAGISLPLIRNFSINLYFGFSYMYFKFEGWNGYSQYGANNHIGTQSNPYVPWDSSWHKDSINGLGIDYTQHWFIFRPGIDFVWDAEYFTLKVGVSASPLANCYAIDNHYQRSPPLQTRSYLSRGFYIEPRADFLYKLYNRFSLGLSFSYQHIGDARGDIEQDEYFSNGTVTKKFQNISGAAYKAFTGEVVFRVSF